MASREELRAAKNTDRELWRDTTDPFASRSIHVTEGGGIGINVGGFVIVKPLIEWHKLAKAALATPEAAPPETSPVDSFLRERVTPQQIEKSLERSGITEPSGESQTSAPASSISVKLYKIKGWDERDYKFWSEIQSLPNYGLIAGRADDPLISRKAVVRLLEEAAERRFDEQHTI